MHVGLLHFSLKNKYYALMKLVATILESGLNSRVSRTFYFLLKLFNLKNNSCYEE